MFASKGFTFFFPHIATCLQITLVSYEHNNHVREQRLHLLLSSHRDVPPDHSCFL